MSTPVEIWRPVVGWESTYEVSSLGRVRSLPRPYTRGGILNGCVFRSYRTVSLSANGKRSVRPVHILVAEAFIGPRPSGHDVRHIDGNSLNSSLSNLTYGTRSENCRDQVRHGVHNQARKTHCPRGHEYTPENTARRPAHPRVRNCRACETARFRGSSNV